MATKERSLKLSVPPYTALAVYVFVCYMAQTTANYFQIYLNGLNYTKTSIGFITGTASLVALIFQPILGGFADSAASKKRLLAAVTALSAVFFPLVRLHSGFLWILIFYTAYHTFFSFTTTMNTSIPVEYCQNTGRPYGALRMLGALGYSVMMYMVSFAAGRDVSWIFAIFPAACIMALVFLIPIPDIRGSNNSKSGLEKVSPLLMLKDKTLVHLIIFQTLVGISAGISNSYFSIYFTDDMQGSSQLFGVLTAVAAMCEIPFLFFSDRLLFKLGERKSLMLLCSCNALKNLGFFLAQTTTGLFIARCFNFVNVMESVCYSLILIRIVRPQFRTSAQTLSYTVQSVASLLVSSYLGGFLADRIGIRPLFLVSAVLIFGTALIFTRFVLRDDFDQGMRR